MSISIKREDKYSLITLEADKLDTSIAPDLKSELIVLNSNGAKNMIIDLASARYCDSSGLSAILIANRLCKKVDGTLVICNVQDSVKKLITISQLDSILNITPTVNEAIDFLFMDEIERELGEEGDD